MMRAAWTVGALLLLMAVPAHAATSADKCQAGKTKLAGKYYACLEKAEATAIALGIAPDYSLCSSKFDASWDRAEDKVPDACPDDVELTSEINDFIAVQAAETAAIIAGAMSLPACGDGSINVPGELCDGADLGGQTCETLGFASGTLACASCELDTSACEAPGGPTGDATAADVLTGRTFSREGATGLAGTMPNHGAVSFTPGAAAVPVPAGYYSGAQVNTDAALVSGNIRSGATIFGVSGSSAVVNTSSATATAGTILSGSSCFVNGNLVNGSMLNRPSAAGPDGSKTFSLPNGSYTGKTATCNDSDLVAANIRSGTTILGVTGTLGNQVFKTGQTVSYVAGDDGAVEAGASRSFTDNGDGTITDNSTGLMWEKKINGGGLHHFMDQYPWAGSCSSQTECRSNGTCCQSNADCNSGNTCVIASPGMTVFGWVAALNASSFAGYNDWRIPNVNELESILDRSLGSPNVPAPFRTSPGCGCSDITSPSCSCTYPQEHWTSTTAASPATAFAWWVDFNFGGSSYTWVLADVHGDGNDRAKENRFHVRAVRGGL